MIVYVAVMMLCAVALLYCGGSVYRGNLSLLHDYHRQHVREPVAYAKAAGRALLVLGGGTLLGGILPLFWADTGAILCGLGLFALSFVVFGVLIVRAQKRFNRPESHTPKEN